ncbi:MAG: PQQ-dependent dehydrogenase, methanol/ethanol family [Pseudomonadota bacterium]|jgi:quinohemoprotein ethanol dehydrogenase|nr:MAG: PQQ-dependent dehydrogenase, methanol/ethanol family [Pseudomonadota bacterium]
MRRLMMVLAGVGVTAGIVACVASSGGSGRSAAKDPAARITDQWAAHGGDHYEQRHSPLTQINVDNVNQLGVAWYAELPERGGYQSTPLVVNGKLVVTTPWSKAYAFDAKTGEQLWKYDPQVPREIAATSLCCNVSNRGAAYWNGKVIWATLDGRLVAVELDTGRKVWEAQTTDPEKALSITGAPRVANGMVFIGQAGAEYHQRGYLSAWDAETGKKLWHWWAVPGNPADGFEQPELEWAAKTWNGEWWKFGGGGTPWDGIVYDPDTGLVIFGTGNGAPWPAEVRSPGGGDNLFTASIVALDAKTGQYRWHYQTVPMDNFDFDNASPLTLADVVINGQKKHVVMQAPKNGVVYVIEAATGKVLSADLFVPGANWLTGFDVQNNWKPILNPHANIGATGKGWWVVPFQTHVWNPQAYNPDHGLLYIPTRYATYGMVAEAGAKMGNQLLSINVSKQPEYARPDLGPEAGAWLTAWDPVKREARWKSREGSGSNGVLSTGGNLVFQGNGNNFLAFRADTGEKVWSRDIGAGIVAGPVSYAIDGEQYVAGIGAAGRNAGGRLVAFKLGGTAELPPPPPPPAPQALNPPPKFGDEAMLARGRELYTQNCTICHEDGRQMGGFPDLRTSAYINSEAGFRVVVIDGALTENGMVSFRRVLSNEDAEAIRAHIVSLAHELRDNPQRGFGGFPGGGFGGGPRGGGPGATLPAQPGGGMGAFAGGNAAAAPAGQQPAGEAGLHQ